MRKIQRSDVDKVPNDLANYPIWFIRLLSLISFNVFLARAISAQTIHDFLPKPDFFGFLWHAICSDATASLPFEPFTSFLFHPHFVFFHIFPFRQYFNSNDSWVSCVVPSLLIFLREVHYVSNTSVMKNSILLCLSPFIHLSYSSVYIFSGAC